MKIVVKLDPVPDAGLPPAAVQLKLYGGAPPVAVAAKPRELPMVPEPGPLIETLRGGVVVEMRIVEDAIAFFPLASVALALTVKVPDLV